MLKVIGTITDSTLRASSVALQISEETYANRFNDFRNLFLAKLSQRLVLRTLLPAVGGCGARGLA